MIRTRALVYTIGERPHVFIDTLYQDRVDGLHAFMQMHQPQNSPRIVEVEIREIAPEPVKSAPRFAEEDGE